MRISLNWLKKYVDVKVSDDELVRLIGARLVEVEGVIDETHKYDHIYIVRVEKVEKIPDTHLTLCQINVGDIEVPKVEKNAEGLVQVVCGAPNVREGMLAVWIAPGAVVPASVNEDAPFVIGKRKMLGKYESNGMLAGADELDFATEHKTIAEIDPNVAKPGDLLADVFDLNDKILDIENKSLTHRPDCFGLIGFAREVAGILGQDFEAGVASDILSKGVRSLARREVAPAARGDGPAGRAPRENMDARTPAIEIDSDVCARYTAIILEKHGELKQKYLTWQDTILSKSGMRPVDPVVDATNYLMLLTGQPLHAFDYDKFIAVGGDRPEINVRLAKSGEKLVLLDDKEIELNENDIVIASGEVPVALAGAMGGKSTEIDENTRNIMLESATFSLYNLRKTQMAHGIFSEAITRFTKGQPPYQTLAVAEECAEMLSNGYKAVVIVDKYPKPEDIIVVKITTDEINNLLGTEYNKDLIIKTLENVEFTVKEKNGLLEVTVPAWRTDIHIKEDIIEEVGRLLGYDNILPTLPLHQTAGPSKMWELKKQIREIMRRLGANELLTYSFVAGKLLEKAGQDPKNSYKIVNSISPELQYIRQSIVPSLLDKAYVNQKIPFDKFALYEMNKVYQKAWGIDFENVPVEKMQMGMVLAERKSTGTAYYKAKKYVEELLKELHISVKFSPFKGDLAVDRPFEPKRSAEIVTEDGEVIGVVGEFKNSVRLNFKLAEYLAGFELDLDKILEKVNGKKEIYLGEIEKRDLTVKTTGTYAGMIEKIEEVLAKNNVIAEITPISIYQPEGTKEKNISVHLEFHQKVDETIMRELEKI